MITTDCTHQSAHVGLDGIYCPDCRATFEEESRTYQQLLFRQHHNHSFRPVWQADSTLLEYCSCGKSRPVTQETLQTAMENCAAVRDEYLVEAEKAKPNSKQGFLDAVEQMNAQIQWCREQLEVLKAGSVEVVEPESVAKLPGSTNQIDENSPMLTSDLAQEETLMLNSNPIVDELPAAGAAVEVVETLTSDEECDRARLELRVQRAFYEAGAALRELRDRKLYRSTHKTFEVYCRDRFGYNRSRSYQFIDAAAVVDNLKKCPQFVDIFPTVESQCRPLTKLQPDEQRSCWQAAVEKAGGKVPSGQIVKRVVDALKEKPSRTAPADFCDVGDVFTLTGLTGEERHYNGCWAIATALNSFTVGVDTYDQTLLVKPNHLKIVDDSEARRHLPAIAKRIRRLRECDLDRSTLLNLEAFGKRTYLTDREEELLLFLEQQYGLATARPTTGELTTQMEKMTPEQLAWLMRNAGLSDDQLKAMVKSGKQILNQRHHPDYFQQA